MFKKIDDNIEIFTRELESIVKEKRLGWGESLLTENSTTKKYYS